MAKSHDMSLCEIDNMISIYSDKIFQLQEQRAKLIGNTFYKLGATKKSGKTAYDKLQIKIAAAEIEAELLVNFIRAGLDFQDRVPILSVLGLPLDMVRARVKFWSGTDGAKSFTRLNLSVPNQFFWYAYFFHPIRAKNFGRVNGALVPPSKGELARAKSEALDSIYSLFKQNIKSCNAKRRKHERRKTLKNNNRSN